MPMEAEAHIPAIQQTVESFFKPKDELLRGVDVAPPTHHPTWPGEHAHAGAVDGASKGAAGDTTTQPMTVDPTTSAGEAPQEVKDVQMQLEAAPAAAGSAGSPSAREGSVKDDGETTEDSDSDGATYSMGGAGPPEVVGEEATAEGEAAKESPFGGTCIGFVGVARLVAPKPPPKVKAATSAEVAEEILQAHGEYQQHKTSHFRYRQYHLDRVDPKWLVGRNVRVYWPIDEAWYGGVIASYDPRTKQHLVTYADGTQERLHRAEEAIRVESYVGEVFPTDPALIDSRPQRSAASAAAAPPPPPPEPELEKKPEPLVPPAAADDVGPEEMVEVVFALDRVDPWLLIGQPIHVFWPDDDVFYAGVIESYKEKTHKHEVKYFDDNKETLHLSKERIKLQNNMAVDKWGEPLPRPTPSAAAAAAKAPAGSSKAKASVSSKTATAASAPSSAFDPARRHMPEPGLPLPGEIRWGKMGKLPGWPVVVWTEADAAAMDIPAIKYRPNTVPVQFFGTYETGRLKLSEQYDVPTGVAKKFHSGVSSRVFKAALAEMVRCMRTGALPVEMGGYEHEEPTFASEEEEMAVEQPGKKQKRDRRRPPKPVQLLAPDVDGAWTINSSLRVLSLGRVEAIDQRYHDAECIYPVGYRAARSEPMADFKDPRRAPLRQTLLCEVIASAHGPSFQVTLEDGTYFVDTDATAAFWCAWRELGRRCKRAVGPDAATALKRSGLSLFGLRHKEVAALVQSLPDAARCEKLRAWVGPRPPVPLADAAACIAAAIANAPSLRLPPNVAHQAAVEHSGTTCAVCNVDEESEANQFVQCDSCNVMVHMECYGLTTVPDGELWLCRQCDAKLEFAPCCAVCPVQGGPLKPTTCGNWVHITCAMWIPEMAFENVEAMEPISGVQRALPDRSKLKCEVCRQRYGAPIQCTTVGCYAAFHPLCARAAGYQMHMREESEQEREMQLTQKTQLSRGAGLRMLSLCKRCGPPTLATSTAAAANANATIVGPASSSSSLPPPPPPPNAPEAVEAAQRGSHATGGCSTSDQVVVALSGSARSRATDLHLIRDRRQPGQVAAALAKRQYVQSTPYLVTGRRRQHRTVAALATATATAQPPPPPPPAAAAAVAEQQGTGEDEAKVAAETPAAAARPLSLTEKYLQMRCTWGERITMGKSAIHGWGVFTKLPHRKYDPIVEYAGQVVRQATADMRERHMYDAMVGAGTYIFSLDGDRNVDATRTGNIAHLLNHSCKPNCFTRIVYAAGQSRVVIFALRDLKVGEELVYDYRYLSQSELLTCNCGEATCRGMVNILDASAPIKVQRRELTPWDGKQSSLPADVFLRGGPFSHRLKRKRKDRR